jgi:pimeloyl-ACP methyl ester carboxylesterase
MANIETASATHLEYPATGRVSGRPTLCLHCSTGSSRQWASLASALGKGRHVIAPDLLGYGENPAWRYGRRLRLDDEVRQLLPLLAGAGAPVDVVGHSFGAAVATKLALEHPQRVRSLCIYEPVLFGLLKEDAGAAAARSEILAISGEVGGALSEGDTHTAAARFIDFWSGDGTWSRMPAARREGVRDRIHKVRADFEALLAEETTLAQLARLEIPVLCLSGKRSPAATRRVADLLSATLHSVRSTRFEDAGHMGPLTHAGEVNASIARFFRFLSLHERVQEWRYKGRAPYTPFAACAA